MCTSIVHGEANLGSGWASEEIGKLHLMDAKVEKAILQYYSIKKDGSYNNERRRYQKLV